MQTLLEKIRLLNLPVKPGSRIWKTAIAVTLAYLITDRLDTPTPVHAVGAVIITMQPTLFETVSSSKTRIWGTIIGLLTGSVYLFFIPINAVTLGLGILLTLTVCTYFHWGAACGISCFVFTSLVISKDASFMDGFYRLIDTGIGVIASLLVNFLYPNRKFSDTLDHQLADIKTELLDYLLANMECYITLEKKEQLRFMRKHLQNAFEYTKEKYQKYETECRYRHYSYDKLNHYNQLYNNLWSIFILIDQIHLDVETGQGVHSNLYSIFSECLVQLKGLKLLLNNEFYKNQEIQMQLNYLTNILQTDLLDIEKTGIDCYELSRNEKREVANKLYLLNRIIQLLKMIV